MLEACSIGGGGVGGWGGGGREDATYDKLTVQKYKARLEGRTTISWEARALGTVNRYY